jgi:hypothetical protein
MSSSLSKVICLVGCCIVATVAFAGMGNATPFGIDEIARNHELDEGAKNHGAVVSEAARHHAEGASLLHSSSTFAPPNTLASQSTIASPQSVSSLAIIPSSQSASSLATIPEPEILLLLSTGLVGFLLCNLWSRRTLRPEQAAS